MSRATIVYISMFLLFGAGMWAVLALGAGVIAPADVSGYWQVRPVGTNVPIVGEGFDIEQSGKYLRLRTAGGRRADLKLVESATDDPAGDAMRFVSDGLELTIAGPPKSHRVTMRLTGPADVAFDARRTVYQGRMLASDSAPASAPTPTATQPLTASPSDEIDAPER